MKSWAGVGEAYATSYASLCAGTFDTLLEALGPAHGRSLLDAGAGTGELVARAARWGWVATGCEPEPTMRAVAERDRPGRSIVSAALPDLPFEDASFDAVTANFVLNHVDDPRASAWEMGRVTVREGLLAATVWTSSPSWFWHEVCERAGQTPAAGTRLPPEKDFDRTIGGFSAMLADAGWREVSTVEHAWTWDADPATLWSSAEGGVASAGLFYRSLDGAGRERFRRGFDETCAAHGRDGVLSLPHTAAVAVGHAP
ncbi:class I SAM-dependent methyltransferase [Microbacterium sp. 179-I 3D4 NHS]|uniref:class I SAM-dependent methyltransferase n=1 Tax=Microbacterium sp. 179-I 3D4 NHS TaxID=3142381 RepID=UPI0039A244FD